MEDNTDEKYVQLALKLKQSTENVVWGFDENLLLQTCNPASPEYDASLDLNMLSVMINVKRSKRIDLILIVSFSF